MTERSTLTIARIAGPVLLVTSLALLVRAEAVRDAIRAAFDSPALSLTLGYFTLVLGLAILATHWRWQGLAQITVTLLGAALTLRGVLLLVVPDLIDRLSAPLLETSWFFYVAGVACLAIGAWFSYVGIQKPSESGA